MRIPGRDRISMSAVIFCEFRFLRSVRVIRRTFIHVEVGAGRFGGGFFQNRTRQPGPAPTELIVSGYLFACSLAVKRDLKTLGRLLEMRQHSLRQCHLDSHFHIADAVRPCIQEHFGLLFNKNTEPALYSCRGVVHCSAIGPTYVFVKFLQFRIDLSRTFPDFTLPAYGI